MYLWLANWSDARDEIGIELENSRCKPGEPLGTGRAQRIGMASNRHTLSHDTAVMSELVHVSHQMHRRHHPYGSAPFEKQVPMRFHWRP